MKKLILKTALITFGAALVLAVSVFGIVSLCAPAAMMRLCESMGLKGLSGDYAYQEYERSGDLDCLARSFLICAEENDNAKASARFDLLYADEGFSAYCSETFTPSEEIPAYSYRDYLCSVAARVKYRTAGTDEQKQAALDFAKNETGEAFPGGNALLMLSVEAAQKKDKPFCEKLKAEIEGGNYADNADKTSIVKILEETIHE